MHPKQYDEHSFESYKEPIEGPKSASGVSSANDFTVAEESTDGRLLNLERPFTVSVKIFPGQFGELIIQAFGRKEIINIEDPFNSGRLLSQGMIEILVDRAVAKMRVESDQYEQWIKWCKTQGLKGIYW